MTSLRVRPADQSGATADPHEPADRALWAAIMTARDAAPMPVLPRDVPAFFRRWFAAMRKFDPALADLSDREIEKLLSEAYEA
jgi:hypothetical protein